MTELKFCIEDEFVFATGLTMFVQCC